jgi:hypothetical protein
LDAEVAYRHERVRAQVGRRHHRWFRRTTPAARPPAAVLVTKPAPAAIPLPGTGVDARDGAPATTFSTVARAGSATTRRAA